MIKSEARVLVRLPNWVGDVCMALPAITALAEAGLEPVLVGRAWAPDLLQGHPWPVTVLPRATRAAVATLRALHSRHGLLLTNSFSSAWQCRLAGVGALGQRGDARSVLLSRALPRVSGQHEVAVFWRLARAYLAWRAPQRAPLALTPPDHLGLQLSAAHTAAAQAALADLPAAANGYVVLAPLAAGTIAGRSKCWPGFAELAARLAARGVVTVVCPGPNELAAARAAVPAAICLPGLGLGAYAAVCRGALVTVANDSGPMHLAAAVAAPVLGVFGPSDPARTRPWHPSAQHLGGTGQWPSVDALEQTVLRQLDQAAR